MDKYFLPSRPGISRPRALICLGRSDQAAQLNATCDAWLRALRCVCRAIRQQVASAVETGMAAKFSPEQRQKFEALKGADRQTLNRPAPPGSDQRTCCQQARGARRGNPCSADHEYAGDEVVRHVVDVGQLPRGRPA